VWHTGTALEFRRTIKPPHAGCSSRRNKETRTRKTSSALFTCKDWACPSTPHRQPIGFQKQPNREMFTLKLISRSFTRLGSAFLSISSKPTNGTDCRSEVPQIRVLSCESWQTK